MRNLLEDDRRQVPDISGLMAFNDKNDYRFWTARWFGMKNVRFGQIMIYFNIFFGGSEMGNKKMIEKVDIISRYGSRLLIRWIWRVVRKFAKMQSRERELRQQINTILRNLWHKICTLRKVTG